MKTLQGRTDNDYAAASITAHLLSYRWPHHCRSFLSHTWPSSSGGRHSVGSVCLTRTLEWCGCPRETAEGGWKAASNNSISITNASLISSSRELLFERWREPLRYCRLPDKACGERRRRYFSTGTLQKAIGHKIPQIWTTFHRKSRQTSWGTTGTIP